MHVHGSSSKPSSLEGFQRLCERHVSTRFSTDSDRGAPHPKHPHTPTHTWRADRRLDATWAALPTSSREMFRYALGIWARVSARRCVSAEREA